MKIHASTFKQDTPLLSGGNHGVSTVATPNIGCGLDQINWQEIVKLLRDVFAYADVQIGVYILQEKGVNAKSVEGDAQFCADDEIERYVEEFFLENRKLETDFTKDSKTCQPTSDKQFPVYRQKNHRGGNDTSD